MWINPRETREKVIVGPAVRRKFFPHLFEFRGSECEMVLLHPLLRTPVTVVKVKEDDDFTWIKLKDIFGHKNEEQFVGCLYELMLTHIGDSVNMFGTPVMQGDDLLKRTPKKCV